jgi:hypothetical protein
MEMKGIIVGVVSLLVFLTGCASLKPIPLEEGFWQEKGKRVGVVLITFPPADVLIRTTPQPLGFGGRLNPFNSNMSDYSEYTDAPLIMAETRSLHDASKELTAEEFSAIQDIFVQGLKDKGFSAFAAVNRIDEDTLPFFKGGLRDAVYENRDFRNFGKSVKADYIVVIHLKNYGIICRYIDLNNYDVEVYADVNALMIEVATNKVLWRTGMAEGAFTRTVNATCSRPDHTPIILDGLKALLGEAAKGIAGHFFSPKP